MKKLLVTILGLACAMAVSVNAADAAAGAGKKKGMTDEQKKVYQEIKDKYDANKDGKLDKEERAKMSQEDKDKLTAAGIGGGKKKKAN